MPSRRFLESPNDFLEGRCSVHMESDPRTKNRRTASTFPPPILFECATPAALVQPQPASDRSHFSCAAIRLQRAASCSAAQSFSAHRHVSGGATQRTGIIFV